MIVVSDTTPLISLVKVNRLDLLKNLYGHVLIPEAVFKELTENPAYADETEIFKSLNFLEVVSVNNIKSVNILRSVTGLDAGESEALILCDEKNADLLLMDERKGREVAKQLDVKYIGTAGILMLAYDKNLIQASEVNKCIDTMRENGIRLSEKLCKIVMEHVGFTDTIA